MIIGLTGKKRSGKTTASDYLMYRFNGHLIDFNSVRINFKDALLDELRANFPALLQAIADSYDHSDYDGMDPWTVDKLFREKPPMMRALLQNYGTEVRRGDDPLYWIRRWNQRAKEEQRHVITDDVRFLNEAQAVKDLGGIVVRIVREDLPSTDTHQSEAEMDQIEPDYTISVKTGEHEKLYDFLDFLIESNESTSIEQREIKV